MTTLIDNIDNTAAVEAHVPEHLHGTVAGVVRAAELECSNGIRRGDPSFEFSVWGWRILAQADVVPTDVDSCDIDWSRWDVLILNLSDPDGLPVGFTLKGVR